MNRTLSGLAIAIVLISLPAVRAPAEEPAQPNQEIFLVRHAEEDRTARDLSGNYPLSSPEGYGQAVRLASMLSKVPITGVFAADACRALQTVLPTADSILEPVIVFQAGADGGRSFQHCQKAWESNRVVKWHKRPSFFWFLFVDSETQDTHLNRSYLLRELYTRRTSFSVLVADRADGLCLWLDRAKPLASGENCVKRACPQTPPRSYGEIYRLHRSSVFELWNLDCEARFD